MSLPLNPPSSPCLGVCRLEADICVGCGRLIGEIVEWPSAGDQRKILIRAEAARRLAAMQTGSTRPDGST